MTRYAIEGTEIACPLLEISMQEDEIDKLRERLENQGSATDLAKVKAKVRELEQQIADARSQESDNSFSNFN